VPFLRLTRDRRGFENTFLMHADRPGDRPRLLYWYRTAPGVMLGRAALDEDAIRTIEEQHPDIDFDWPAIIALSEVMTPEDEAPAPRPQPQQPQQRREKKGRGRDRDHSRDQVREEYKVIAEPSGGVVSALDPDLLAARSAAAPPDTETVRSAFAPQDASPLRRDEDAADVSGGDEVEPAPPVDQRGLVDELAGREIAGRLRARFAEIVARIDTLDLDGAAREAWLARAEAIDPDAWESPDAVLQGVSHADALFEKLKTELGRHQQ
jgi:hypothetical protein